MKNFRKVAQRVDTAQLAAGDPAPTMTSISIASEPLTHALADEISPLWQQSWDECSEIKKDSCSFHGQRGFKIQPDIPQYFLLASTDSLLVMTLRDEGRLVGYSLSIFYRSLHHAPVRCVNIDTFYIQPEHRAYMRSFIAAMEERFQAREILQVCWPLSPKGKLFDILQLLGYAPDDVLMEKQMTGVPLCV